jgi:uncharacterized cupredoxin-like copper-binding protein
MRTTRRAGIIEAVLTLVALATLAFPLGVVFAHDLDAALQSALCLAGHAQGSFVAGEPGNPREPARVVPIAMIERYGMMLYLPDRIEVRRNEQIRFILTNAGDLDHEFVLATATENDRHAEKMRNSSNLVHDDPNAKTVGAGATTEILWRFTTPGEYEFSCLIPGHREAGMTGVVVVR